REILEQVAANKDAKPGTIDRQLGDFYTACMDEAKVEALGAKPLEPKLARIAAVKDKAGLFDILVELQLEETTVPFGIFGDADNHAPTDVIAWVAPSGLGLPDRDYYVKT